MEQKNREINLNGRLVAYSLRTNPRVKNLRITIAPGGVVTAIKPRFLADGAVEKFLRQKSDWVLGKIEQLKNCRRLTGATRADYKRHAPAARILAIEKIAKFCGVYGVSFNRLAIRDQRTRWGSCSRQGNLNFNYRIALIPERLADYIVAHEVCHLRELNHSPRFWNLVAQAIPDYRAARKELKKYLL